MGSDKTVILVTGGNSGIGYETVIALSRASADYHVVLAARSLDKGQKALSEMQAANGTSLKGPISTVQIDVTERQSIRAAKDEIESKLGKLDVLINNAGITAFEEPDTLTALRQTFEANVFGQMVMTETFEPLLKRSPKPCVIYVSSSQGSVFERLNPDYPHVHIRGDTYRMSKAALNMLSACHRHNFADWNCKVLAFNPGFCVSNLTGEKGREMRVKMGARDPKDPALSLTDVVMGKRDSDIEKNGMIDLDGGVIAW
ncbi:putative short chain dehydrogenase/reductase [Xylariaceae sp. FL0016]|nr:putative short chain dehydrogenase/reductase [Xylariaceae sp. FL0016]